MVLLGSCWCTLGGLGRFACKRFWVQLLSFTNATPNATPGRCKQKVTAFVWERFFCGRVPLWEKKPVFAPNVCWQTNAWLVACNFVKKNWKAFAKPFVFQETTMPTGCEVPLSFNVKLLGKKLFDCKSDLKFDCKSDLKFDCKSELKFDCKSEIKFDCKSDWKKRKTF